MPNNEISAQIYNERWKGFIDRLGIRGSHAFKKSGITVEELGTLVREMDGGMALDRMLGPGAHLHTLLGERFHKGDVSGGALLDVNVRRMNAMFAAFTYSLHIRQSAIHDWLMAALRLHLDRSSLLAFMLSTKFGIEPSDIGQDFAYCQELFGEWLKVHRDLFGDTRAEEG